MNKKTTLLSLSLIVFALTQIANAQLLTSGPFSTGATSSINAAAPAGFTWSELQTPNTSLGAGGIYNNAGTTNLTLADDFVVPSGSSWTVTTVDVFGYQTGFAGTTVPPIDVLRMRIWNGDPANPLSTVVAGDMTTNRLNLTASGPTTVYRMATATPGTTRRIFRYTANIAATLAAGTYWVEYQVHATNDAAAFFPPVTILGTLSSPSWNAKQSTAGVFAALTDLGSANTLALPFQINGTTTLAVNENTFEANISLSPNPVSDVLAIDVATNTVINSYEIYDATGRVVQTFKAINTGISEINVAQLSVGNYIIKLNSENASAAKKFIKK